MNQTKTEFLKEILREIRNSKNIIEVVVNKFIDDKLAEVDAIPDELCETCENYAYYKDMGRGYCTSLDTWSMKQKSYCSEWRERE